MTVSSTDAPPPKGPSVRAYRAAMRSFNFGWIPAILVLLVTGPLVWPSRLLLGLAGLVSAMLILVMRLPMLRLTRRYSAEILEQVGRDAFPRSRR